MNKHIADGFLKEAEMNKESWAWLARLAPMLISGAKALGGKAAPMAKAMGSNMAQGAAFNAGSNLLGGGNKPAVSPGANAMPQKMGM